ncbi:hypothetical protein Bca101_042240 [Brassica carinata]
METRYEISNRRAVLASTAYAELRSLSSTSVYVDTHILIISPTIARNPRKILSLYDSKTNLVSVFTRGENSDDPAVKIRLSTRRLASTISRQFPSDVLFTVAACSSVEGSILAGVRPSHKSRSYFFFTPRYGPGKIGKNRVIWVESNGSLTGERTTTFSLKTQKKMGSGAVLQIHGIGKITDNDTVVQYADGNMVYNFREEFAENLQKIPKPFPPMLKCLMDFEHSLRTPGNNYLGPDSTYKAFPSYVKEVATSSLWSMLQLCSMLGEQGLLDIISMEIGQRINKLVKYGVEAVKKAMVGP